MTRRVFRRTRTEHRLMKLRGKGWKKIMVVTLGRWICSKSRGSIAVVWDLSNKANAHEDFALLVARTVREMDVANA